LWNNYANIRDLKLASLDMESQEVQSDLQIQSHVIDVLDQYYGLQNLYVSRAALAETLKNARAFADEAAELVRLGGKTQLDMMDTEIQVRNFENEARELENTIAAAERALGVLLNAPDRVKLDPVDVVTTRPYLMGRFESALPAIRTLSRDQVVSVSPELRLSILDVERSSQSLYQTRLGYFPVTSFRLSQEYDLAGFVTEDASANQRRMVPSLSAQFQVSWTVWDWLSTHRNIVNTSKDLESSRVELSRRSRQVANDFETQLEQYDILVKSIENAKLVVAQAEKQVEYTLAMYQLGRITLLQAQTASERLITARNSLASRLRQQYVAAARLMLQAGFNLLPDGVDSALLRAERPAFPSSPSF
jgi:outer membrane protein TolC